MRYVLIVLLLLPALAAAGAWRIETVDSEGTVGDNCSLVLDSNDYPHISYIDNTNRDLKYARWDGDQWLIETVDSEGSIDQFTSLALDSSGNPHISYFRLNSILKYAQWDGDEWLIETVDSDGGSYNSLALDSNDYPHISYCEWQHYYDCVYKILVKYAHWNGSEWLIEVIDTLYADMEIGEWPDQCLVLDNYDLPFITYGFIFKGYGAAYCSRFDGLNWQRDFFDETVSGFDCSMNVDSEGHPHLVYTSFDYTKYAIWDGNAWLINTICNYSIGQNLSIALDSSDYPHLSFINSSDSQYAYWDGDTWQFEIVDSTENQSPSIAVDSSELPCISFNETISYDLKYARYDPNATQFHLLEPEKGEVVYTDKPLLDWEDSNIPDHASYTLFWWSEALHQYNRVTDIIESEHQITEGIVHGDRIFWLVRSVCNDGGYYWAEETDWYFDVDVTGGFEVVDLGADATDEGVLVNWRFEGEPPVGVRVLRSVGEDEPVEVSGALPGSAVRWLDRDVSNGIEYRYWLEVVDAEGLVSRFGPTEAVIVPGETPGLVLYAAYPNPSRETINFVYSLPEEGRVTLSVYDLSGRRIATLVDSEQTAGRHEVAWNCAEAPSGVYLYRLETDSGSLTQRLVVSR